VALDGAAGRLTFSSGATVRALEIFYRGALGALGWSERPASAHPGVAELEFVKGDEPLLLTLKRDGTTVAVTATGNALKTAAK
jgi:hypothetical protein